MNEGGLAWQGRAKEQSSKGAKEAQISRFAGFSLSLKMNEVELSKLM
jgi:hypothetical protein